MDFHRLHRAARHATATIAFILACGATHAAVNYTRDFAPQDGLVTPAEQPYRAEICLNGLWQFQSVKVPADYVRDQGIPPSLPLPDQSQWEHTSVKVPSPWNVNTWGGGRNVGEGTPNPYWPGSVAYPSYPARWDDVEMGWLRRRIFVPADWKGRSLMLHFDSVAGDCQVFVNGHPVGQHFDMYTPFAFDVTPQLKPGADNELLVGVRGLHLFNKTDKRYPKALNPYANGSFCDALRGIWQDVSLVALAPVHISDTFVKPLVDQDMLEVEVSVNNTTSNTQKATIAGTVAPWINLAGLTINEGPEPKWKLGSEVLTLPETIVEVPPGNPAKYTLRVPVANHLKFWTPETPNLNGLVLSINHDNKIVDRHYTRFGWRQFKIQGQSLLLNDRPVQIFADIVHPFGAFVMTRRYAWAWYRMVKDFGGNGVRIHAQPMPKFYLDLADEMGLLVLDETALFGSSLKLNFAEPVAWERFADHYDALVLRDRNHPSVFGWSMGNELFAIFDYNKVGQEERDKWYPQLTELALRAAALDPTRSWISCDGDEDLRGTLPVWAKHFGHGLHLDKIPDIQKPLMVGESGGTYYANPPVMAEFNGDRAYESYRGRNEALAIDLYQNVVKMARPLLTYFSASEIVWFGVEPLAFGYADYTRLPNLSDGVFFTAPYKEGKPGYQVERLPPFAATLNPGYDPALPLYQPLPLFDAMKAALAPGVPGPSPWDHRPVPGAIRRSNPVPTAESVSFVGSRDGDLYKFLQVCGLPFSDHSTSHGMQVLIVDGATLTSGSISETRKHITSTLQNGGTCLISLHGQDVARANINALLPHSVEFTNRQASMLELDKASSWTVSLPAADRYFADNEIERFIMTRGLKGPFVSNASTILKAANTDWTQFLTGESTKTGSMVLYEKLQKPEGAAMVVMDHDRGQLALATLNTNKNSKPHVALWQKLFANMGIKMADAQPNAKPGETAANKEHDLLRDGPQQQP